jgi:hypothetical protein
MTQSLLLFIDLVRREGMFAELTEHSARRVGGVMFHITQLRGACDERSSGAFSPAKGF